jgi:hypothetical protein
MLKPSDIKVGMRLYVSVSSLEITTNVMAVYNQHGQDVVLLDCGYPFPQNVCGMTYDSLCETWTIYLNGAPMGEVNSLRVI